MAGFDVLGDDGFRAMVLARIVEPTFKAEVVRVLVEIGAPAVSLRTLFWSLARSQAATIAEDLMVIEMFLESGPVTVVGDNGQTHASSVKKAFAVSSPHVRRSRIWIFRGE